MERHKAFGGFGNRVKTQCGTCPKTLLYPEYEQRPGLMPGNELAIDLYWKAQGDERVASLAGLHLIRTLSLEGVSFILDTYDDHFADSMARQEMLEKLLLIDRVYTDVRATAEAASIEK